MFMAIILLSVPLRLTQSALGQKAEAKPVDRFHRERSQGRAAMRGLEVACLPSLTGLPLGQGRGRASPLRAKSVLSASSFETGLAFAHAASNAPTPPVLPAITSNKPKAHPTDEVPRRPGLIRRVNAGYKSNTKGQRHAPVTGMASPQPRLEGWQQRRSKRKEACAQRQNLRVPQARLRFMGQVSFATQSHSMARRDLLPPTRIPLRNRPQQPAPASAAVHPR